MHRGPPGAQHDLAAVDQAVTPAHHRQVVPLGRLGIGRAGVPDHYDGGFLGQATAEAVQPSPSVGGRVVKDRRDRKHLGQPALGHVREHRAGAGRLDAEQGVDLATCAQRIGLAGRAPVAVQDPVPSDATCLHGQAGDLAVAIAQQRDDASRQPVETRDGRVERPQVDRAIVHRRLGQAAGLGQVAPLRRPFLERLAAAEQISRQLDVRLVVVERARRVRVAHGAHSSMAASDRRRAEGGAHSGADAAVPG